MQVAVSRMCTPMCVSGTHQEKTSCLYGAASEKLPRIELRFSLKAALQDPETQIARSTQGKVKL